MLELEQYFEDYNTGDKRTTPGRTITETCVAHNVSPKQHEEITKIS